MIDFENAPGSGTRARESSYLENLNPPQKEAVLATEGPLIVIAGAGSGKTKMLTSRMAHLIQGKQVPAYQILAVTFTNKAAREMKERVLRHLGMGEGYYANAPEIGTFHSICLRILRKEQQATPFTTSSFSIFDDSDQLSLLKRVCEKLNLDDKAFNPKSFQAAINRLKCDAVEPKDINPSPHDLFEKNLKRVYEEYQKDLFAANAIDFGEIICLTYRILRDHEPIRQKYQKRYRYIHVDEYQDTNRSQYLLLSQLAKKEFGGHENICVVGDEDQSIYKWRGADIHNILDFEKDYPATRTIKLEQNYRSTKFILEAANGIIRNNRQRKPKSLWTENQDGEDLIRRLLADERAEAEFAVSEIKRQATYEGRSLTEFAIFYRTHAQSRSFEDVLRREKITYDIYGGLRFYDRKEIKDILAYFRTIVNPADSISLKRIINTPARGIGKSTIDHLEKIQTDLEQNPLFESTPSLFEAIRVALTGETGLGNGPIKKLKLFYSLIEQLRSDQPTLGLSEIYHRILDLTAYVQELKNEGTDEATARIENLEEFDSVLAEFESDREGQEIPKNELLTIFLEEATLATDMTADGKKIKDQGVTMMSLHSSKGLEFPVVFMVGMEEDLFPSARGELDEEELEEERRLCYVGMTRAREKLYMTGAQVRRIWGQIHYQEPSRFFQEIPVEHMDFKDLTRGAGASAYRTGSSREFADRSDVFKGRSSGDYSNSSSKSFFEAKPGATSRVGKTFQHPDFGFGRVVSQEGSGKDEKIIVRFERGGERKFLTRFVESYFEP